MSTAIAKNFQVGSSPTATNNFTIFQPATPDGTLRIGNGNTGITSSLLTINSSGAITQTAATANGVMYANGSKVLTTGSALTFDGTNFGVGTTSPAVKFVASNGGANGIELAVVGFSGDNAVQSYNRSGAAYTSLVYNALNHRFATSGTEQMRLDSSGNLLMGTTSNTYLGSTVFKFLSVNTSADNTIGVGGGSYTVARKAQLYLSGGYGDGGTRSSGWFIRSQALGGGGGVDNRLDFVSQQTNGGSEAVMASIDSSGNLLVGTTSAAISSGAGVKILASGDPYVSVVSAASTSAVNNYMMYSTGAGAYRFYVGWDGTIRATSTSIAGISDISLKENVRDLETGLTEVMALQPRRFDWKNGDAQNVAGFVAQEVEQVLPELVTEYQYAEGVTKKSLKMGDILPTLVKAIQELKAEFDAYKLTHP